MKLTVEALARAPVAKVWAAYTTPQDIRQWNAASDDWHTTRANVDLRVGGEFSSRMEARDGSAGFDFAGTYTRVEPHALITAIASLGSPGPHGDQTSPRRMVGLLIDGLRYGVKEKPRSR